MAFSISTRNLPSRFNFSSYSNALLYHNNVKPLRNSNIRPLVTNRKGPYEIRLDNYTKNIQLVYHSTAVVTITPENHLLLDLTYNSLSTRLFADALTPMGVRVSSFDGRNVVSVKEGDDWKEYLTDTATFDLTEVKLIKGQTRVQVRSVNTKLTSEPRKILKAIENFLGVALAITPTYLTNLRDAPQTELIPQLSRVPTPGYPETFLPWVRAVMRRVWLRNDLPVLMRHLRSELYDDYAVYSWTTLADGVLPTKGQTYRMIEEN